MNTKIITIVVSVVVITLACLLLLCSSSLVFIRKGKLDCSKLQEGMFCKTLNKQTNQSLCYKVNDSDKERGYSTEGAENCTDAVDCVRIYNECASNKLRDMMKKIV